MPMVQLSGRWPRGVGRRSVNHDEEDELAELDDRLCFLLFLCLLFFSFFSFFSFLCFFRLPPSSSDSSPDRLVPVGSFPAMKSDI